MLIVISLWLALPSAHAIAICMDSNGGVALGLAVDGACAGSRARGDAAERILADGLTRTADAAACHRNCTDIVLGGGRVAVPPPASSGKHRLSRPTDEAVDPMDGCASPFVPTSAERSSDSSVPTQEQSRISRSVVLKR